MLLAILFFQKNQRFIDKKEAVSSRADSLEPLQYLRAFSPLPIYIVVEGPDHYV
jgi:hypothetical protein